MGYRQQDQRENWNHRRSPRARSLASPPYMLEFDGADEIFAVDGMNPGFPLQLRMDLGGTRDLATILPPTELPLT